MSILTRSSRVWLRLHGYTAHDGVWDRRYPQFQPFANPANRIPVDPAQEDTDVEIVLRKFLDDPDHGSTVE